MTSGYRITVSEFRILQRARMLANRKKAVELRLSGLTHREIAKQIESENGGNLSPQRISQMLKKAIRLREPGTDRLV